VQSILAPRLCRGRVCAVVVNEGGGGREWGQSTDGDDDQDDNGDDKGKNGDESHADVGVLVKERRVLGRGQTVSARRTVVAVCAAVVKDQGVARSLGRWVRVGCLAWGGGPRHTRSASVCSRK
jgi:hypothetical protein